MVMMTVDIITIVYYVIQENLAMKKSEALYEVLDLCGTAIGNQLHCRRTPKAIVWTIDDF